MLINHPVMANRRTCLEENCGPIGFRAFLTAPDGKM
jgi:hypothetical protein